MKKRLLFTTLLTASILVGCSGSNNNMKKTTREEANAIIEANYQKDNPYKTADRITLFNSFDITAHNDAASSLELENAKNMVRIKIMDMFGASEVGVESERYPYNNASEFSIFRISALPKDNDTAKYYVDGEKVSYTITLTQDELKSNQRFEYNEYAFLTYEKVNVSGSISDEFEVTKDDGTTEQQSYTLDISYEVVVRYIYSESQTSSSTTSSQA